MKPTVTKSTDNMQAQNENNFEKVVAQVTIGTSFLNINKCKKPIFGGFYAVEIREREDDTQLFYKDGFCLDAAKDYSKELIKGMNNAQRFVDYLGAI